MIKLLFSGKQILIASLVLILLANTTNLTFPNAVVEKTIMDWGNTVEAAESDDKKVCEDYNGEWKSIDVEMIEDVHLKTMKTQTMICNTDQDISLRWNIC